MESFLNGLGNLFTCDVLLVVLGSWLTVMAQVFGLRGPLRKLIVEALKQDRVERKVEKEVEHGDR